MRFFTILRNKDTLQNNFTFLNRMIITLMQMIGIHASMQNTSVNGLWCNGGNLRDQLWMRPVL